MRTWTAKDLEVRPITRQAADRVILNGHYSGKVVKNSQLHFGVFLGGGLRGALQFGPPMDRSKILGLVRDAPWESVLELNRMWLADDLPRNGESRSIGVACRMIAKHAAQVKWVVSFADGTQCGDGTIYRASGFILTGIKESDALARLPNGTVFHRVSLAGHATQPIPEIGGRSYFDVTGGRYDFKGFCKAIGAIVIPGFQFRYIRFLDATWRDRLTVPEIPFDDIPEAARMIRGQRVGP